MTARSGKRTDRPPRPLWGPLVAVLAVLALIGTDPHVDSLEGSRAALRAWILETAISAGQVVVDAQGQGYR